MGGPAAGRLPQRFDDEQKYGIHRDEVEEQANHIVVEKMGIYIFLFAGRSSRGLEVGVGPR